MKEKRQQSKLCYAKVSCSDGFVTAVTNLTHQNKRFRAFRITPVTVTTTVNINIGQ